MSTNPQPPVRLASEDVIIAAPMSYVGSAQRIMRVRRRAPEGWQLVAVTVLAILLVVLAWLFVTSWYLVWGIWLVPYRLLRRGARKRKVDALRHRELMGTIQGSAAASASAIVASAITPQLPTLSVQSASELIADADREDAIEGLRKHLLAGRLTPEEFEQRVGSAHAARTRGHLEMVMRDLPAISSAPVG